MSGIAGIFHFDERPVVASQLSRMIDCIAHRGPDGSGVWSDGGCVGLGHRMLRTTPESKYEQLPFRDTRSGLVITADARLDNRNELLGQLELSGESATRLSDSALILAAYNKWGESCPERLLGDFAFAIWDERKQSIFCARDHFGVRPFYYFLSADKGFAFATEIKALLSLPQVPRRLNEVRVADHLAEVFDDSKSTFYLDIWRLPPSHSLTISRSSVQLRSYWALDPERELRLKSDEDYAEAFRELFTEAVRCRLRSSVPLGSMLSGGLDSSSIVCVARNLLSRGGENSLSTFSTFFDKVPACDERKYITAVLSQNGVQSHYIPGDQHGPLKDLEQIHWHADQPFYAPNFAMVWSIYKTVKQQGVRVLLDGHDGDSVVSHGYQYLDELACAGRWLALARELKGLGRHYGDSFWSLLQGYAWAYGLNPLVKKNKALRLTRRVWKALARRTMTNREPSSHRADWRTLLNPGLAERVGMAERYKRCRKTLSSSARTEREGHYKTLTQPIQPFALEVHNTAAAAFGIEPRYPFWDRRLVEFCLALPPEQKMHGGWTRLVLRRAMVGVLPAEVQWRGGKMDFTPSLDYGLRVFERDRLERLIINQPAAIEPYVNIDVLQETYRRFLRDETGNFSDLFNIWKCVSLSMWIQSDSANLREGGDTNVKPTREPLCC